jgi:capsular polysaccharide biosynthesis protein
MQKNEPELIDYMRVIWEKKWIIIFGTILCMVLAALFSFSLKPVYEIDAIIQPGKFFVVNEQGNFEEFVVEDPQQIADKVMFESYNSLVAMELKKQKLPRIKAENIKETLLSRIWIRSSDIEESKQILEIIIRLIKKDIDVKINIEISNIDAKITAIEIEKERILKQIEILKQKLKVIGMRKSAINKEMESMTARIKEMENEQLNALKREKRTEVESLALLLYSTEIQQSRFQYDLLNEKLSRERLQEETINSDIEKELANFKGLENSKANLIEEKGRIDYTKVIKEPTPSSDPVFPKLMTNLIIAFFSGLMIFILVAFLIEFFKRS